MNEGKRIRILLILFSAIPLFLLSCDEESAEEAKNLPSDEEITRVLQTQLASTGGLDADNIQISVEEGIVRLKGSVKHLLAKKRATEVAEAVTGVISVVNSLKITATRPDSAIEEDVAEALATDPATEKREINSTVNNGMVTLKGAVDSWQEKQLAAKIVSGVKGVKGIENLILVADNEDRKAEDIRAEIESRLKYDIRVNDERIKVGVTGGVVTLEGAVGSAREKSLAAELAHVAGVEKVVADQLEVRPELKSQLYRNKMISALTPEEIARAVKRAFAYDPRVPEDNISVTIKEGVAVLEGTVKNLGSKIAAEADALHTAGITSVENNIEVRRDVVVKPEVPTTDEAIRSRILNAIHRDPYVEEAVITVRVEKGVAELTGTVNSQFEKERIEEIVSTIKGIISIDNRLKVKDD